MRAASLSVRLIRALQALCCRLPMLHPTSNMQLIFTGPEPLEATVGLPLICDPATFAGHAYIIRHPSNTVVNRVSSSFDT